MWTKIKGQLSRKSVQVGLASTISLLSGAAVGYAVATRQVEAKYMQILDDEVRKTKAFYSKLNKTDEYADPVKLAEGYVEAKEEETPHESDNRLAREAIGALREYKGAPDDDPMSSANPEDPEALIRQEIALSKKKNIFENSAPEFDWEEEMARRAASDVDPYIVTEEEFLQNEPENSQITLTYYEGDDVLADERDQPVADVENTVGEDNLRFGYGSTDPNTVYIRNPRIGSDMEIVRSEGTYAEEVLGFVDELKHSGRRGGSKKIRKFRETDE